MKVKGGDSGYSVNIRILVDIEILIGINGYCWILGY